MRSASSPKRKVASPTKRAIAEKARERAAYLSSLKQKLIIQAKANDVTAAQTSLRVLSENLPDNGRFLVRDAPEEMAQAYWRMAWQAVRAGQLKSAVDLIDRGRDMAPTLESIATARARYIRYQALDDQLSADTVLDVHKVSSTTVKPSTSSCTTPIQAS